MRNPQIKQIEDKIERLKLQLEYLNKIESLKEEQKETDRTRDKRAED